MTPRTGATRTRRSRVARALAVGVAVLAAVLVLAHVGTAHASAPAGGAPAGGAQAGGAQAATTASVTPAGGLCSVPGVGDIGGLLGFCALGSSGVVGDLNNVCQPSIPEPEPADAGIDAMVAPPASGKQVSTLYDEYGVAGDYWAATDLQCSDMTSLIGNNVAGMVFDAAKSIDRVTITVYQSAAGEGILSWLQRVADTLITSLGNAIYFPYLSVVVILGAMWLAWQGLIRKRATRSIEGTIWMIAACAAAIFLIGAPAQVTGLGRGLSDGISDALNVAFAKLPSPGPSSCVPVANGDPQVAQTSYSYTSGSTVVDQNADELWSVLVCKPWLTGEFGTSVYTAGGGTAGGGTAGGGTATAVNTYGRSLLWAQAIATNEKATPALIQAKQAAYAGIASSIQANDPAIYPLFQGKQWTTRLEVSFAALFAALVAGVLVLLIAVTLILLKLSFLLLLIVGPFFLLIGAHPGFGRVVALRWVEMLVGVLLKQSAVALVLSLLLYCYALIMGTSDAVLPWALKILMIALVTVAAFIYRKPFQHLFSAVGYGVIGSQDRAELDLARAGAAARANTIAAATAIPAFAAYRAGRWARRNPGQAARLAAAASSGGATAAVAAGLQAGAAAAGGTAAGATGPGEAGVGGTAAEGVPAAADAAGGDGSGVRTTLATRVRAGVTTAATAGTQPPPLNLPPRGGSAGGSLTAASATQAANVAAATAHEASGAPPSLSTGSGGVPPPTPGVWPGGRPARSAGGSGGGGLPPRRAAGASGAGGDPPRREPSRREPARSSAARSGAAQARSGQRQSSQRQTSQREGSQREEGWLRRRVSGSSSTRQPTTRQPTARQPAPRRTSQPSRRDRSSDDSPDSHPATWLGQELRGPLASGEAQSEGEPVPFWLRPTRRE